MKLALESGGIMWYNRDVNTYEGYGPFLLPDDSHFYGAVGRGDLSSKIRLLPVSAIQK